MPYRVKKNGETLANLRDRQAFRLGAVHYPADWMERAGTVDDHEVERYEPDPPAPYEPAPEDIALTPAQFFSAVDGMAGLTPDDPAADVWMQEQIKASTVLSAQDKRAALNLVRKALSFERSHSFMDTLGAAILGVTPAELDAAFLATYQQSAPAP